MKFNDKLMKLRKENSLSQEELAEKLGVTRQTISKWELGQTTPDMEKLSQISNVFGVSVDELLNETGDIYQNNPVNDTKKRGKNIIIIVLVAVILILLGTSVASFFNNKNNNTSQTYNNEIREDKKNTGIFGWLFDFWDQITDKTIDKFLNTTDKMMDKMEEWEEKEEEKSKESEKKFQEKANQMYEIYKNEADEMNEKANKLIEENKKKSEEEYEKQKEKIMMEIIERDEI